MIGLLCARPFASLILQCQLSFINSFTVMSPDALSRRVLALRLTNHGAGSLLHLGPAFEFSVFSLHLRVVGFCLTFLQLVSFIHCHPTAMNHVATVDGCSGLPLDCCLVSGHPVAHWRVTLFDVVATRRSFCALSC